MVLSRKAEAGDSRLEYTQFLVHLMSNFQNIVEISCNIGEKTFLWVRYNSIPRCLSWFLRSTVASNTNTYFHNASLLHSRQIRSSIDPFFHIHLRLISLQHLLCTSSESRVAGSVAAERCLLLDQVHKRLLDPITACISNSHLFNLHSTLTYSHTANSV